MTLRGRALRAGWLAALCLSAFALAQAPGAGDALGAGLTPPTATRYADPAWYDLLDARWATDADGTAVLELELAAIDPEAPLLQPIVEAYLMHPEADGRASLPGTGLEAAEGFGWAVAVRVVGTGAWAWSSGPDAPLGARSLGFEVVGRTVRVDWPSDLPVEGSWVAISGVYDPFSDTGWRPFSAEPSPWAFAGPAATPPVVSVVPGDEGALARLHATLRLPRGDVRAPLGRISPWWWWMLVGMALVGIGLTWRTRPRAGLPAPEAPAAAERDAPASGAAELDVETAGATGADAPAAGAVEPKAPIAGAAGAGAPAGTAVAADPSALIGDDDVRAKVERDAELQSEAAERPADAATETADASVGADGEADATSSSARTTRAPSEASRSAKRS